MAQVNLVAAGFALTAVTYGLARFAYGLMLPDIRADLEIDATGAGWIGGGAFATYCMGIAATLVANERFSPRLLTVISGLVAACGLALAASAASAWTLGLAMALAGLSTGLTSPPLAAAVARSIDPSARPWANGAVNAGTAAGIVFSGVAILVFRGSWQTLYLLFAIIGVAVSVWLYFAMPSGARDERKSEPPLNALRRQGVVQLCASSLLAGAASTAIWTFGGSILRAERHFSDMEIATAWILMGMGGVVGMGTGFISTRFGLARVHRLGIVGMTLSLIGLGLDTQGPVIGFLVMVLFGLAYIVSSGAFLLWGIQLYPDRPALGLGLPFLILALGQSGGAPLFGALWAWAGAAPALTCFVVIMITAARWAPRTRIPAELTSTAATC